MHQRLIQSLLSLVTLAALAAPTSAQVHKDERLGYSIRFPKKWTQIPIGSGQEWICAKFESNTTDAWTDDSIGYTTSHRPSLRVVAFVDEFISGGKQSKAKKDGEPEAEEPGEASPEDDSSSAFVFTKLYRDYAEFLKDNFNGGYFITKDSEEKEGATQVRKLEMRAEHSGESGHRLILTWIYPTEIGKIAVEFEVLEAAYKKYKSDINKTFKSFAQIPRTEKLVPNVSISEFISLFTLDSMTPEEREIRKREIRDKAWATTRSELLEGWTAMELGDHRVITRHDKKHAESVVHSIEVVTKWLEQTFPRVGPGEYVSQPIIRICKDFQEELSFRESRGLGFLLNELVTHKDSGGATGFEWEYINRVIKDHWFRERDRRLDRAMPAWLDLGLTYLLAPARVKGSNLDFKRNNWELVFKDEGEPWDLKTVMTQRRKDLAGNDPRFIGRGGYQALLLVRFLVSGKGSKGNYKGFLENYMWHLSQVVDELNKKDDAKLKDGAASNKPKTEQEEDELLQARNKNLEARETEILLEAYERTAASMDKGTLEALKKSYAKEVQ